MEMFMRSKEIPRWLKKEVIDIIRQQSIMIGQLTNA